MDQLGNVGGAVGLGAGASLRGVAKPLIRGINRFNPMVGPVRVIKDTFRKDNNVKSPEAQIRQFRAKGLRQTRQMNEVHRQESLPEQDKALFENLENYHKQLRALGPRPTVDQIVDLRSTMDPELLKKITVLENSATKRSEFRSQARRQTTNPHDAFKLESQLKSEYLKSLPPEDVALILKVSHENRLRKQGGDSGLFPFNTAMANVPVSPQRATQSSGSRNRASLMTGSFVAGAAGFGAGAAARIYNAFR